MEIHYMIRLVLCSLLKVMFVIFGCPYDVFVEYSDIATIYDVSLCQTLVVQGCTDLTAFNYDETANTDDGSCIPIQEGTDESAFNYDPNSNTDNGTCEPIIEGCTNPNYLEYNEYANVNDGSCNI